MQNGSRGDHIAPRGVPSIGADAAARSQATTFRARGGVSALLDDDSLAAREGDAPGSGAGTCDPDIARHAVEAARRRGSGPVERKRHHLGQALDPRRQHDQPVHAQRDAGAVRQAVAQRREQALVGLHVA